MPSTKVQSADQADKKRKQGGTTAAEGEAITRRCRSSEDGEFKRRRVGAKYMYWQRHCKHGGQKAKYKECGGASIREHGRQRHHLKEFGGASVCEHGRRRSRLQDANGLGQAVFLRNMGGTV